MYYSFRKLAHKVTISQFGTTGLKALPAICQIKNKPPKLSSFHKNHF